MPLIGAPLGPGGLGLLAQTGQDPLPGGLGAPQVSGIDRTTVLGQNAVPSAPGADPGVIPNLNPFNNAYGVEQCTVPSAPGKCEQFGVAPGDENADVTRRQWFGRYIDMYRAGMLKGGLLGQMPQEQLGEPLPGTAPPPGTEHPAGAGSVPAGPGGTAGRGASASSGAGCTAAAATATGGLTGLRAKEFERDGVTSDRM